MKITVKIHIEGTIDDIETEEGLAGNLIPIAWSATSPSAMRVKINATQKDRIIQQARNACLRDTTCQKIWKRLQTPMVCLITQRKMIIEPMLIEEKPTPIYLSLTIRAPENRIHTPHGAM